MTKSQEPALPVPRWLIALPVVCALVAAIVIASIGPGPVLLAIFFVAIFVAGYLYFYMIGVWRQRGRKHDTL